MAKIAFKNEKTTAFGGINFVLDKFDALLGDVIDRSLGICSTYFGYQYSEIVRALFAVYLCSGDCMEDINLFLRDVLAESLGTRIPSADTVLRAIEELATGNLTYTAKNSGKSYDFNIAGKLNSLLVELLLMCLFGVEATGRVKSFLFRFIAVPAKWTRTARQSVLNIYSGKPYELIWDYG